jgi:hypothetical protein
MTRKVNQNSIEARKKSESERKQHANEILSYLHTHRHTAYTARDLEPILNINYVECRRRLSEMHKVGQVVSGGSVMEGKYPNTAYKFYSWVATKEPKTFLELLEERLAKEINKVKAKLIISEVKTEYKTQ